MDSILKDSRFAHISKDARFRKIPKREKKVKIDKRFQSMFHDKRFQIITNVDKRGRPLVVNSSEHLQRFYDQSDDSDEESDSVDTEEKVEITEANADFKEQEDQILTTTEKSRKLLTPAIKEKLHDLSIDYARGEGRIESDSSSGEESSEEENVNDDYDHGWGELDRDAGMTEQSTRRIAICNMDWDRITAQDLMVLFNSFLPSGGLLLSVVIYPSEFGMKRMAEEDKTGPAELTASAVADDREDDSELTEDQREKLRQYQLNRLKYFYAILTFDSSKTANHIYAECDGLEYESSMNRLDLRFVPDDTDFEQEPKETCTEIPELSTYKPRLFRTTALTQVKVDLTWDETDPSRQDLIRSVHSGKVDNNRLNQFLAVSSSEDEAEEKKETSVEQPEEPASKMSEKGTINKYKALLSEIEKAEGKKKQDISMEITWDLKLEQKATEKVKEATAVLEEKTPFEEFLDKKKAKRKMKKTAQKLEKGESDEEGSVAPFSDDELPSDIDLNDSYFQDELNKGKSKKKGKKKPVDTEESLDDDKQKRELELLMMDETEEGKKQHFSLKKIEENEKKSKRKFKLKKRKKQPEINEDGFKVDVQDDRFGAVFTSHLYNIDPADPQFRSTEGMKSLINEKLRRKSSSEPQEKMPKLEFTRRQDAELNILVKSVKRKTEQIRKSTR